MSGYFNEAAELFGLPSDYDTRCQLLGEQVMAACEAPNRLEALRYCLALAVDLQADAYSAMLPLAFEAPVPGGDFEWVRQFFHASARCGEARGNVNFIASALANLAARQHPPGEA